jgi:TolB protein
MNKIVPAIALVALSMSAFACGRQAASPEPTAEAETVAAAQLPRTIQPDPREIHLSELHMLTDGGENAEAYFSFGGDRLIFQSTRPPYDCDQIFSMKLEGSDLQLVSTGTGRTTCAYYYPDDEWVLYASTHGDGPDCPPVPDHSRGYVWPIYASYDIYRARPDGSELSRLTDTPGYDAEATISPLGDRIVFTSMRDGDLDIYSMNLDGSDVVRLTDEVGYDGGPFFSPDGTKIVYRARHPSDPKEIADYQALLADGLIRPSKLEIRVMDADGSNKRQITDLGAAAFAPFFLPSGDRIIFSSNYGDPQGREFELFMVDLDGSNLEQITYSGGFDGFPMFAPDGRTFVFCSNRSNSKPGETNVFVTTWQD